MLVDVPDGQSTLAKFSQFSPIAGSHFTSYTTREAYFVRIILLLFKVAFISCSGLVVERHELFLQIKEPAHQPTFLFPEKPFLLEVTILKCLRSVCNLCTSFSSQVIL